MPLSSRCWPLRGANREERNNVEVVGANGSISGLFFHHAGNAVYGDSLRALLLFSLCSFAFRAFQFPGCCLAASVFSTSSLDRDRTQQRRSGLSYRSGRILSGCHPDLLRKIPQTRRGKERVLCACPSFPIFISSAGRAWSAHRLASFYPAHHLYPYALVLLPIGAQRRRAHAITIRRSVRRGDARHPDVPAGRTRQTVGAAVVRLGPQSTAETLCPLLRVAGGCDRRSLPVTAIKPSPDHSFELFRRSCGHIIFAGRHKRAWRLGSISQG